MGVSYGIRFAHVAEVAYAPVARVAVVAGVTVLAIRNSCNASVSDPLQPLQHERSESCNVSANELLQLDYLCPPLKLPPCFVPTIAVNSAFPTPVNK
jgi:hypothetical protein